jgi:TrmH family RNA methyltransferase
MPASSDLLRVVLVSPRNPLNIGAAARAMSNFGFPHLRLVNAYSVAYLEARSAVNAAAVLTSSEQYHSVADAVKDCSLVVGTASRGHRVLEHPFHRLETGGPLIREALAAGPVALLFGSEKFGLGNEELAHCHWLMHIPTRNEHESMNLGQAVAVCLYELIREVPEASSGTSSKVAPANAENNERIADLLHVILHESGYTADRTEASTVNKISRMVRRLNLSTRDAIIWLGMLRQILWKVRKESEQ